MFPCDSLSSLSLRMRHVPNRVFFSKSEYGRVTVLKHSVPVFFDPLAMLACDSAQFHVLRVVMSVHFQQREVSHIALGLLGGHLPVGDSLD